MLTERPTLEAQRAETIARVRWCVSKREVIIL